MISGARLRPLLDAEPDDVKASLKTIVERLAKHKITGAMRLSLQTAKGVDSWTIDARKMSVHQADAEDGDLELRMSSETWLEIATGRLAPLEAFAQGKLAVRGDTKLAVLIYERLKDDAGGDTTVCK